MYFVPHSHNSWSYLMHKLYRNTEFHVLVNISICCASYRTSTNIILTWFTSWSLWANPLQTLSTYNNDIACRLLAEKSSVKNDTKKNLWKYSWSCTIVELYRYFSTRKNLFRSCWSVIVCFWMLTAYVICSLVVILSLYWLRYSFHHLPFNISSSSVLLRQQQQRRYRTSSFPFDSFNSTIQTNLFRLTVAHCCYCSCYSPAEFADETSTPPSEGRFSVFQSAADDDNCRPALSFRHHLSTLSETLLSDWERWVVCRERWPILLTDCRLALLENLLFCTSMW